MPPASGQIVPLASVSIGLGFSASTIAPVSQGVPVFTTGDGLWVSNYSPSAELLALNSPSGKVVATASVPTNSSVYLYTFSAGDPSGIWVLKEPLVSGFVPVQFALELPASLQVTLSSYGLGTSGQLNMNFSLGSSIAYDISTCLVGAAPPITVTVPIPGGLGTGSMVIQRNGSVITVGSSGEVTAPFSFWVELHHDYAYGLNGNGPLVSRDQLVAQSGAVPFSPGQANVTTSPLSFDLNTRLGRYELRAFFESSNGLATYETPVLNTGTASWIWLSGCTASSSLVGSHFSLSASLQQTTSLWPRAVYVMYKEEGVEGFTLAPVHVAPSVIDVVASPWGKVLNDSQFSVSAGNGTQSVLRNGVVYLLADRYPVQASASILHGVGKSVVIQEPYTVTQLPINSSKLIVQTTIAASAATGAAISIDLNNQTIAAAVSKSASTDFYLPPGTYDVTVKYQNSTLASATTGVGGAQITLSFSFAQSVSTPTFWVYAFTAAVGVAASLYVWISYYRRRRFWLGG